MDDSSSSDEETASFTTTSVLLGYASKEATGGDPFSQLGGTPTWPDPQSQPSADVAKCLTCNSFMCLLLQLNGDLPERYPAHERRLYIFSCKEKACRRKTGSVRALRGVKHHRPVSDGAGSNKDKTMKGNETVAQTRLGDSIFGVGPSSSSTNANPFAMGSGTKGATSKENPFAISSKEGLEDGISGEHQELLTTFAEKARISNSIPHNQATSQARKKVPWPDASSTVLPKPYPSYYLDAEYESLDPTPTSSSLAANKSNLDIDWSTEEKGSADDNKEAFESNLDQTFIRFADRLAQNPEQVLRYDFASQPLLYSKVDAIGRLLHGSASSIPRCSNCGAARVFEVQLVPHAIAALEADEGASLDGMDWGTIIVGVCGDDCAEKGVGEAEWGWCEEWVGVQWEEAQGKLDVERGSSRG